MIYIQYIIRNWLTGDWEVSWLSDKEDAWRCVSHQLRPTLCNPMDYSPPGSTVHGIFQARILDWVTIPFSRRSSLMIQWSNLGLLNYCCLLFVVYSYSILLFSLLNVQSFSFKNSTAFTSVVSKIYSFNSLSPPWPVIYLTICLSPCWDVAYVKGFESAWRVRTQQMFTHGSFLWLSFYFML